MQAGPQPSRSIQRRTPGSQASPPQGNGVSGSMSSSGRQSFTGRSPTVRIETNVSLNESLYSISFLQAGEFKIFFFTNGALSSLERSKRVLLTFFAQPKNYWKPLLDGPGDKLVNKMFRMYTSNSDLTSILPVGISQLSVSK